MHNTPKSVAKIQKIFDMYKILAKNSCFFLKNLIFCKIIVRVLRDKTFICYYH